MNQVSRQNAKMDVEKDFYKLINNSNFGYDCQNNAGNYFFHSIYDEIEELLYAKWYQNVFDQDISEFVSSEILEQQIEEEFLNKIPSLDPNDEYYEARKNSFELKKKRKKKELGWVFSMRKSRHKKHFKNSINDIEKTK